MGNNQSSEAKVLYQCAGCGKGIAPRPGDPVVSSNVLGWGNRYHWDCAAKRYRTIKAERATHEHAVHASRSLALMNAAAERKAQREHSNAVRAAEELFGTLPDPDAVRDACDSLFGEEGE